MRPVSSASSMKSGGDILAKRVELSSQVRDMFVVSFLEEKHALIMHIVLQ